MKGRTFRRLTFGSRCRTHRVKGLFTSLALRRRFVSSPLCGEGDREAVEGFLKPHRHLRCGKEPLRHDAKPRRATSP